MKVIAVVKFNDEEALVFDTVDKLVYTKIDENTIVGTNGILSDILYLNHERYAKAFAGRKFDIELDTGEVVHCDGQWWSGVNKTALEHFDDKLISVTAHSIDGLKDCYVFRGYTGLEKKVKELRDGYKGEVFDYWEYKKQLRELLVTK